MGAWVTARCNKRRNECNKQMPPYVTAWLERISGNPKPDPDAKAPAAVQNWLNDTVEDPDWVEP